MSEPYEIIIARPDAGSDVYTRKDLDNLSGVFAVDIVGDELTVDNIMPVLKLDPDAICYLAPSDYDRCETSDGYLLCDSRHETRNPLAAVHGAQALIFRYGRLITKGYVDDSEQVGPNKYEMKIMSPIGLLVEVDHPGGIYTGQSFLEVVTSIVGGAFPFTVEEDAAALPIYGWLPYQPARDNLHQLLFASGVTLTKDVNGDVVFAFLYDTDQPEVIADSRVFRDGGSVKHEAPATLVAVTEHTFEGMATDERVTVFDNTDGTGAAVRRLVTFREAPIHDLEADGLTVHESGVNYAIVSGTGTLTGQKYTHITQVITATNDDNVRAAKEVPVKYVTLISTINSQNVAKRVLAYNTVRRSVKSDLVYRGEQCGRKYELVNAWGGREAGFMASMTLTMSNIIKAQAEFITGYTPTGQGNNYSRAAVLTGSGSWPIPEGVTEVKAVLVSGGEGGSSGGNGEAGSRASSAHGTGGTGGVKGTGGRGGRVLSVVIDVSSLDALDYSCGEGGAGGVASETSGDSPVAGALGTDTVLGSFSTAQGQISSGGVVNLFTGAVYGLGGGEGVAGQTGGGPTEAGPSLSYQNITYTGGAKGSDVKGYATGVACGGWGGGAAAGSNGGRGYDGQTEPNNGNGFNTGGSGGTGGRGLDREDAQVFGQGGDGGRGSTGGKGGAGCIILYY